MSLSSPFVRSMASSAFRNRLNVALSFSTKKDEKELTHSGEWLHMSQPDLCERQPTN